MQNQFTGSIMQNKLLLCGCGWLGGYAAKHFSSRYVITGTTRTPSKAQQLTEAGISPLIYELGQSADALADAANNSIVILNIPPGRRNPDLTDFTRSMCDLITTLFTKAKPALVIFISTTSVYGDSEGVIIESSAVAPSTASGMAHVEIEQHLVRTAPQHSYVLRPAGLVGPDRHPVNTLAGRTLTGANQLVNLVHIDDVLQAIEALIQLRPTNPIWHLCSNDHPKRGIYYPKMALRRGLDNIEFSDNPDETNPGEGKRINASATLSALQLALSYPSPWDM